MGICRNYKYLILNENFVRYLSRIVRSKDGKYKYKIGRTGNGPGEYMEPKDFEINENKIRILSYNKLVVYSLSGQFKRNVRLGFAAENFTSISPEYDAYYGAAREDRIIVADKNGKKKYSFFEYSPKNRVVTPFLIQKCDLSDREKGRLEELTNICNQITKMSNPVILIARIDSAKFSNHAF